MLIHYKKDSNAYGNNTLLYGEGDFAATRRLKQKRNGGLARGGEALFADKIMFLPYKK